MLFRSKEKQEKEAAKKNVSEGGVRGMGRGNVKGRDYDPDKMFSQMTRPKAYRPPWEKSKLDKAFDAAKAKQDFTGAIKKLPPGKKTPKAMVRPRDYMKPNQASKVGVTEQTSTHAATSLAQRTKRTKPFRAWEPPAHTDHSSLSGKNESLQRVADVKMVKVRLPDGKIVYRKQRSSAEVQHETYTGSEPTSSNKNDPSNRFVGTDSIVKNYASVTPGQNESMGTAAYSVAKPQVSTGATDPDAGAARVLANTNQAKQDLGKKHLNDIRKALSGIRESNELNESFAAGFELAPFARDYGITVNSSFTHHPEVQEIGRAHV